MARIDEIIEKYNRNGCADLDLNELAILVNYEDSWDSDLLDALYSACPVYYTDPVSEVDPDLSIDQLLEDVPDSPYYNETEFIFNHLKYRAVFKAALDDDELDAEGRAAMESILEDYDDYTDKIPDLIADAREASEDEKRLKGGKFMKKIINNRLYDTDTAKAVSPRIDRGSIDDIFYGQTLYRKRTGEYFLHREGYRGVEDAIQPQTYDEAREWAAENLDADQYISLFGAIDEDGSRTQLGLTVSTAVAEKARRAAASQGISLSAYVESLIQKED